MLDIEIFHCVETRCSCILDLIYTILDIYTDLYSYGEISVLVCINDFIVMLLLIEKSILILLPLLNEQNLLLLNSQCVLYRDRQKNTSKGMNECTFHLIRYSYCSHYEFGCFLPLCSLKNHENLTHSSNTHAVSKD